MSGQTDLAAELRQDAAKSEAAREARRARVVSELQSTIVRLTDELRLSEDRCDVLLAIRGTPRQPLRIDPPGKRGKRNVATAVALASDWHVEERVDPRTVNGLNRYDPDIARERAARFFERVVRLWMAAKGVTC